MSPIRFNNLFVASLVSCLLGLASDHRELLAQSTKGVVDRGRIAMMSPQFNPIASSGEFVFVANTPNNTIDVIDKRSHGVIRSIPVGIEPVGIAIRPDGKELWVANHVSDSV